MNISPIKPLKEKNNIDKRTLSKTHYDKYIRSLEIIKHFAHSKEGRDKLIEILNRKFKEYLTKTSKKS